MTASIVELQTERLLLRSSGPKYALGLLQYYQSNSNHFAPWEPLRPEGFYTLPKLEQRLVDEAQKIKQGDAIYWLLFCRKSGTLAGECRFLNIVRGPFQACYLGFSLAQDAQGKGLMYEALSAATNFIFSTYGLHRIMANYQPKNLRSGKLLARLGFEIEGKAQAYLKINGRWEDHILTALINKKDS